MRQQASILHLDLDAFFAAVEQRDKPSLRGKPVVVGGTGGRGVVSTASYEARELGIRSAMSTAQARRLGPHAAYLAPRFDAYKQSSKIVMATLRELSELVQPLSIDEAFVDLAAGGHDCSDLAAVEQLGRELRERVLERTDGLTASVGIGTSKFMAKVASELAKPDGLRVVAPGSEVELLAPMSVRAIPGVGPATVARLDRLGIRTIAELQQASKAELVRELGQASGQALHELAFARDDRAVVVEREAKSISVEDTFETDLTSREDLEAIAVRDAAVVVGRMRRQGLFARTITLKVRMADFTTWSRSRTLHGATDSDERIGRIAVELLGGVDVRQGVRLLGVGVANFTQSGQEELFILDGNEVHEPDETTSDHAAPVRVRKRGEWPPGWEVIHPEFGRGWVWGAGLGRVTVRFEDRTTGIGPVRTFATDDPALTRPDGLLPLTFQLDENEP